MKQEPVRPEQGRAMAEQIGAYAYLECSAKTKEVCFLCFFNKELKIDFQNVCSFIMKGVREVFETATRAALQVKKKRGKKCEIL